MRLLLIEDSEKLRRSLVEGLRQMRYAVDDAGDVRAAESLLQLNVYDLIVLDLMLPDGSGIDLLKRLRRRGDATAVLILTARDSVEDRVNGLDAGGDDYLCKPFALDELQARVRTLLRRVGRGGSAVLRIGDLRLDLAAMSAVRGDRTLKLAPREWALLELLAHHPGVVLSRSRIESAIYDSVAEPMSNVVDAAVYALRRELEKPGETKLLHTRRGLGYMLTAATEVPDDIDEVPS